VTAGWQTRPEAARVKLLKLLKLAELAKLVRMKLRWLADKGRLTGGVWRV
jgi:hypothetical protein